MAQQFEGVAHAQFAKHPRPVGLHGTHGNAQLYGDDLVGPATGQIIQDLALTRCEAAPAGGVQKDKRSGRGAHIDKVAIQYCNPVSQPRCGPAI